MNDVFGMCEIESEQHLLEDMFGLLDSVFDLESGDAVFEIVFHEVHEDVLGQTLVLVVAVEDVVDLHDLGTPFQQEKHLALSTHDRTHLHYPLHSETVPLAIQHFVNMSETPRTH